MIKRALKKYKKSRGDCGLGLLRTSKADVFNEACKNHDAAYILYKGTRSERIRKDIDKTFLKEMLTRKKGIGVLPKLRAYAYYFLARTVGIIPWYFGKSGGIK